MDLFQPDDKSDLAAYIPGDQGRYKSVEDLAKGKYESDLHIKNIERENAELRQSNLALRDEVKEKATLAEYLDKITKASSAGSQPASDVTNPKTKDDQPFNPQQIESLLDDRIKKYEVSKTKEQNAKAVTDALKERYGQNYHEVLTKQVEELGLTREAVNYLAENSPRAFFKTLGLDEAPKTDPFQAPPRKSPMFAPKAEPDRTWSYYEDMRAKQPALYRNPKTQEQMHKDYMRLGTKFEDGNFLAFGQESAF